MFLLDIANEINSFLNNDVYTFAEQFLHKAAAQYIIISMEAKIYFLKFSYGVAQELMSQLSFDDIIQEVWALVPNQYLGFFTYMKIPETLNLVISALMTRFVLDFFE